LFVKLFTNMSLNYIPSYLIDWTKTVIMVV